MLDGQECETLTDVVVKLSGDSATFLFLCLQSTCRLRSQRAGATSA